MSRIAANRLAVRPVPLYGTALAMPEIRIPAPMPLPPRQLPLRASPATAPPRASGASRSASWRAGRKAATPAASSSSAPTAATTPTWITPKSQPGFSSSAAPQYEREPRHLREAPRAALAADGPGHTEPLNRSAPCQDLPTASPSSPVVMIPALAGWLAAEHHATRHPFWPGGNLRSPGGWLSREMSGHER
jgi:hypothetical protein